MTNPQTEGTMPNLDKAELQEILEDFYEAMKETEYEIQKDTYDYTDDTFSDYHLDWVQDDKDAAINKIMKLLDHVRKEERRKVLAELKSYVNIDQRTLKGIDIAWDDVKKVLSPQPPQKEEGK